MGRRKTVLLVWWHRRTSTRRVLCDRRLGRRRNVQAAYACRPGVCATVVLRRGVSCNEETAPERHSTTAAAPPAAPCCPAGRAQRTRVVHSARWHTKTGEERRRAPADWCATPDTAAAAPSALSSAQQRAWNTIIAPKTAEAIENGGERCGIQRKTLASACTCRSAARIFAAGGSGGARFLLSRAERRNTSSSAPLKVMGGGGGAVVQLVQRTCHHRTPPPSTTRPRATRRRAPTTHRTRGAAREAVAAAARASRRCWLGESLFSLHYTSCAPRLFVAPLFTALLRTRITEAPRQRPLRRGRQQG